MLESAFRDDVVILVAEYRNSSNSFLNLLHVAR